MTTTVGSEKWSKKNRPILIGFGLGIAVSIFAVGLTLYMVYSDAMLQSITQAEATILGFFGLIAAYLLTSYDARLDRLEQQRFDWETKGNQEKTESVTNRMRLVKIRKRGSIFLIVVAGGALILSLLLSITTQGFKDSNSTLAHITNMWGLSLFSFGAVGIFTMFFVISREPEELD